MLVGIEFDTGEVDNTRIDSRKDDPFVENVLRMLLIAQLLINGNEIRCQNINLKIDQTLITCIKLIIAHQTIIM